jgi:hypothetical protein
MENVIPMAMQKILIREKNLCLTMWRMAMVK